MIKIRKKGFTLVELMLVLVLFSMIMTAVLSVVQHMYVARIKTMNRIALTEELYRFSELLFTTIKDGGTIDYEEYWNRKMTWNGANPNEDGPVLLNGHYRYHTGVGNFGTHFLGGSCPDLYQDTTSSPCKLNGKRYFGEDLYVCRSKDATSDSTQKMGPNGCALAPDNSSLAEYKKFFFLPKDKQNNYARIVPNGYTFQQQRYGQYALQFWDFNGNADEDRKKSDNSILYGDEDGDGNIIGDEDDVNLWDGPEVFWKKPNEEYLKPKELYLINHQEKTRLFFRWNVTTDPAKGGTCKWDDGNPIPDNCIGNIQVLKLTGHDIGLDHDGQGPTAYDGKIDTWVCADGWQCDNVNVPIVKQLTGGNLATGGYGEWIDLFPSNINVRNFKLDIYPRKDPWLAVSAPDCGSTTASTECVSPFIHPYVRLSFELGFSHGKRRSIKNENPIISVSTTINLGDFN